jgi:DNA-binding SARP family transcriptional activator
VGQEKGHVVVAGEGAPAGEQLVDDAAERVQVGRGSDLARAGLLGGHVGRGAQWSGGVPAHGAGGGGDAEVDQPRLLRVVVLEQDVRRLHVPVHDLVAVGVVERPTDAGDQRRDVRRREPPPGHQGVVERPPGYQPHRQPQHPVDLAGVVDRHDRGVVEAGHGPSLDHEAAPDGGVAMGGGVDDLERDLPFEGQVDGSVDRREAARADDRLDAVPPHLASDQRIDRHAPSLGRAGVLGGAAGQPANRHPTSVGALGMALLDLLTRPPRLPRAVDRPRLRRLLLDGVEPGCLVVAPPGSGKTVAAAQLLQPAEGRAERRTAWCRLATGAANADDLVRLVGAALGVIVDDPGVGPLERAAVILDAVGDRPVVLVVDDYDLARSDECDAVLAEVLALLAPDCRLVVCSSLRPAGLVGRASIGQLAVVGADDLAFTDGEVAELLVRLGREPAEAAALRAASAGWATAVTFLAEVGGGPSHDLDAALEAVLDRAGLAPHIADPERAEVLALLAAAPAVDPDDVAASGLDPRVLGAMAATTALLRPVGDGWGLLEVVREPVRQRLGDDRVRRAAVRLAPALAGRDPLAAAALLLDAGDESGAADLLARHASDLGADAVVPLLYRMRPEVRRQLPPLLSAARATVEMDAALAQAERRVATAGEPAERAEAQVAVGTILLHRGQLAAAGAELEAALRALGHRWDSVTAGGSGPPSATAPAAAAVARGWLGLARLWAGDLDGAAAAVAAVTRSSGLGSPWSLARWVAAELLLTRHDLAPTSPSGEDLDVVGRLVGDLRDGGWPAAADAMAARLALAHGAETAAATQAAAGYQAAAAAGGLDLLVAGPPHAWCLARAGRWDEAAAVADELRRRLGAVDTCARLHADLIAEAQARVAGDVVAAARPAGAIATTRRLGFAPVETVARRWLPPAPAGPPPGVGAGTGGGLDVAVLGPVVVMVDGRVVEDRAWRSRKAREVLVVLALAGAAGRSRDEVIEAVWPERDPAKGRSLLRTALADVRRVLEPSRQPGEPSRFVTTRGDRLILDATTDLARAEHGGHGVERLVAAWGLFRGDLAADDPYAESLDEARRHADQLRSDVATALASAATATTTRAVDPDVVVDVARFLLQQGPWHGDAVRRLADAREAAGDDATAARIERLLGAL